MEGKKKSGKAFSLGAGKGTIAKELDHGEKTNTGEGVWRGEAGRAIKVKCLENADLRNGL